MYYIEADCDLEKASRGIYFIQREVINFSLRDTKTGKK